MREGAAEQSPRSKISSSAMNSYLYLGEYEKFLQTLPVNDSVYIRFYRGLAEYYLKHFDLAGDDFDRAYREILRCFPLT